MNAQLLIWLLIRASSASKFECQGCGEARCSAASSHSVQAADPGVSSSAGGSKSHEPPGPGALVRSARPPRRRAVPGCRWFCVTSVPEALLGVWHVEWPVLAAQLPSGRLFGSGVRLKRLPSEFEAVEHWYRCEREWPPPRHPPLVAP